MMRFIQLRALRGELLRQRRGGLMSSARCARRVIVFCVIGRLGKSRLAMCWRFGAPARMGCRKLQITMRDAGLWKCWWLESDFGLFAGGKRGRTYFACRVSCYFLISIPTTVLSLSPLQLVAQNFEIR